MSPLRASYIVRHLDLPRHPYHRMSHRAPMHELQLARGAVGQ